jgi:hypothetical protein
MITKVIKIYKNIYITLHEDSTFFIILFLFLHFSSENIDKNFESLYFGSQIAL